MIIYKLTVRTVSNSSIGLASLSSPYPLEKSNYFLKKETAELELLKYQEAIKLLGTIQVSNAYITQFDVIED